MPFYTINPFAPLLPGLETGSHIIVKPRFRARFVAPTNSEDAQLLCGPKFFGGEQPMAPKMAKKTHLARNNPPTKSTLVT